MKNSIMTSFICGLSVAALSLSPLTAVCADTENAKFSINCPSEVIVDNEFTTSIACNSAEEFASLSFKLTFDPSVLQLKKNDEGKVSWNVNTDSGDPSNDSLDLTDAEDGIIYLMMPDEVTYHYLSLDLTFTAIKEGNSNFAVDVTEINKDSETPVLHDENPVATATISVKEEHVDPPTTTATTETETTTTSESTTTTTTTAATTTTLSESSTTSSTTSENNVITTTTSSDNVGANNNTTSSSTTKPSTTTSKQTTTSKATTTSKSNSSSNKSSESPNTGDNFPFLPLFVTLGASVSVAFVTRRNKSE